MPPLPSRQALQTMKRADLQGLCKEYGVRANLKSEALIELLLQTQSVPSPPPPRRRIPSNRKSSQAGPSRISSAIIHDIHEGTSSHQQLSWLPQEQPPPPTPPPPPSAPTLPRTRKAKDLQTHLGVGRPRAAGGNGPRAVTKPSQRSRRGNPSRIGTLEIEPTIEEETEPTIADGASLPTEFPAHPLEYPVHVPASPWIPSGEGPSGSNAPIASDISLQISNAVGPLQIQLWELRTEMSQLEQLNVEVRELKTQVTSLLGLQEKYNALEAEVRELRLQSTTLAELQEEMRQLKGSMDVDDAQNVELPSTPKPTTPRMPLATGVFPSSFKATYLPGGTDTSPAPTPRRRSSAHILPHPGFAATTLGKRSRAPVASDVTGSIDRPKATSDAKAMSVVRHDKKRPRLSAEPSASSSEKRASDDASVQIAAPRIPSFAMYSGVDDEYNSTFVADPPPSHGLPEFFSPSSPSGSGTKDDFQPESHQPFNFNFPPMSSTPASTSGPQAFMPPFPFPEPPQSPSPSTHGLGYLGRIEEEEKRTDIFKSFGLPSPRRPRLSPSPPPSDTADSAIGERNVSKGKQRDISSNDVAAGLGLHVVHTGSSTDPSTYADLPPAKKTMYGTEVEGETRFGDFGIPGSFAKGFWTGR